MFLIPDNTCHQQSDTSTFRMYRFSSSRRLVASMFPIPEQSIGRISNVFGEFVFQLIQISHLILSNFVVCISHVLVTKKTKIRMQKERRSKKEKGKREIEIKRENMMNIKVTLRWLCILCKYVCASQSGSRPGGWVLCPSVSRALSLSLSQV